MATAPSKVQVQKKARRDKRAQLDKVAGGALVNAVLVDVVDVRNTQVAIPVNASVAAGVLGAVGLAGHQDAAK